jgi:beta-aspartyl-peptidase (threonine type)
MRIIVHGGAGSTPDEPDARQAVLDEAAETGASAATPLDAVESAVHTLESSPRFNAGAGGAVQSDGVVRTDAGVMTADRSVGAACSMRGVEHAVSVARAVLEETPHVLLAGDHAVAFADAVGVETDADLLTDATRERYAAESPPDGPPPTHLDWLQTRFGTGTDHGSSTDRSNDADTEASGAPDHDTVGAVAATDETVAAATSTGGRSFALAGRVGDVPQVGSGFFCTEAGGASATGAGEDIVRVTLSRLAVDALEDGHGAQAAAETAMAQFDDVTGSSAGVIVCTDADVGSAFTSEAMQTSVASRD